MRRSLSDARIVLTGASAGIGASLARQLAEAGAWLLLTARRRERLAALADQLAPTGGRIDYLAGDITDPDHRRLLVDWVDSHWSGLDILINNAGVGALGPFASADADRLRRVMEVNFFAPCELTRLAIPLLKQGKTAAIVNISSVLGHRAVPNKSEYCASKFAMHGWSDALRLELAGDGIDVILVSPSTTASEFFDSLLATDAPDSRLKAQPMSTDEVARHAIRAIKRGRREVILTAGGKSLVWLDRLSPRLADYLIRRSG